MAKSNLDWDASPAEKYAEQYWQENGFTAKLLKRYQSKSIYEVSCDGMTRKEEIPYSVKKFGLFMEQFQKSWDMAVELRRLSAASKGKEEGET